MPLPSSSSVVSDSTRFCGFSTPFSLRALDVYSSPASFSASPWFGEHGILELPHLLPRYADLLDMLPGGIPIQMVWREDWRSPVALPKYDTNRKTSESPAACRTWQVETVIRGLEVTFETDLFSSGFCIDVRCRRTVLQYQYASRLPDIPPFKGFLGSMMVSQPIVLWLRSILPPKFRRTNANV